MAWRSFANMTALPSCVGVRVFVTGCYTWAGNRFPSPFSTGRSGPPSSRRAPPCPASGKGIISGSAQHRGPARVAALSPAAAARSRDARCPVVLGQACHLLAEPLDSPPQGGVLPGLPLDLPPQGLDLFGVPPLFPHLPARADLFVMNELTGFSGRFPAVRFPPSGFQPCGLRRLRIACLSWASSGCW